MPSKRKHRTFDVEKLVAHRWTPNGFEFLVKWSGCDRHKRPWEDSWESVFDVGEPLLDAYFKRLELREAKIVQNVDISPLLNQAREKVAVVTAAARTKCRPRVHEIALEALTLQPLAMAFLEMVSTPSSMSMWFAAVEEESSPPSSVEEPIGIELHVDPVDGVHTWQVVFKQINQVAAFCSFHSFMGCREGVGALRYNIGRDSNEDCMVVGVPMQFKVVANRGNNLVSTSITFATCWINGKFGTMTPPPQVKGMLRKKKHFDSVLAYAKKFLPHTHPLAVKGWKQLPEGIHSLPSHVAVPAD
mmetsp:Transcript_15881/g.23900  ORF Transcript_15881/g.23900 Transcript_15881/m.23900 type:complete len:302 (-) Transcript_15881:168-1073(-)